MTDADHPDPPPEPIERLRHGPLTLLGRIVDSSNATFLVTVGEVDATTRTDTDPVADETGEGDRGADDEGDQGADDDAGRRAASARTTSDLPPGLKGVYKPLAGERPLWDFPEGLHRREVAAYELSAALGWPMVPATVERDAELGPGSVQRFVEADFSRHHFTLRDEGRHDDQLLRIAVFDILANNTDRKAGHVLVDEREHLWGIDNALCFSTEARLRTVIWDFAGQPIPDALMDAVAAVADDGLPPTVTGLLLDEEVDQVIRRARALRSTGRMPHDPTGRAIPWPLV